MFGYDMKLIAIYIKEYKGIKDLLVPLDSSFDVVKRCQIHIKKKSALTKYYDNNILKLLLGKNGAGKTTIMEFIEGLFTKIAGEGAGIFYKDKEYYVHSNLIDVIRIDADTAINNIHHSKEIDSSLIVVNNLFELDKFTHKRPLKIRNRETKVVKITNDMLVNKGRLRAFKEDFEIQKDFFDLNKTFMEEIGNPNPQFLFNLYKPSKSRFNSAIANIPNYSHALEYEIKEFYENVNSNSFLNVDIDKSDIKEPNFGGTEKESFSDIVSKTLENIGLIIFDKQYYMDLVNNNDLVWHLQSFYLSDCLWETAKDLELDKEKRNYLYLSFLLYSFNNLTVFQVDLDDLDDCYFPKLADISNKEYFYENMVDSSMPLLDIALDIEEYGLEFINSATGVYLYASDSDLISKLSSNFSNLNNFITRTVDYGWTGFSSGESAMIKLFSRIHNGLVRLRKAKINHFILAIDEVDLYLHPEWQRSFLKRFISFLSNTKKNKEKFQVLFSSHSPIIASDFLPEDILLLSKDKGVVELRTSDIGFCTGLNQLYNNSFSMKSTLGEYSRDFLNQILEAAEHKEFTSFERKLIKRIGDKVIKSTFEELLKN
jgi:predicted ATP-binding protein involved in virulence